MDRVQLFPPEAGDIRHIAKNLRTSDAQELCAAHGDGLDFEQCLRDAVLASVESHVAVTAYGEPFAVFGLAPVSLLGGVACPWMLGTDVMERYGREIVTLSREHVARWNASYDQLFNYVDARNLKSIKWLKRTGFHIFDPEPHGVAGLPFHRFERCT